jgi:hypothetical protein
MLSHYGTCHLFRVILLHGILQNDAFFVLLGLLPLCHFGNGLHVLNDIFQSAIIPSVAMPCVILLIVIMLFVPEWHL